MSDRDEFILDVSRTIGRAILSECFLKCQPDRGDVFGWIDDRMPELSGAAAHAVIEVLKKRGIPHE